MAIDRSFRKRTIVEVIDVGVSRDIPQPAEPYLTADNAEQKIRVGALKQKIFDFRKLDPLFRCPKCYWALFIAQSPNDSKYYFFKHFGGNPKVDCPWYHERAGNLDRLNSIRFGPEGESDTHRKMVNAILLSTRIDSRFSESETRRAARNQITGDPHKYPDVQAVFLGKRIAFEAQWSRQYCQVVTDRERFYRDNGWWITWIFNNFKLGEDRYANIWTGNRYNALEIGNDTIERTLATHKFHLKAHWVEYSLLQRDAFEPTIERNFYESIVDIGELIWDFQSTKPYYKDSFVLEVSARKKLLNASQLFLALARRTPQAELDDIDQREKFLTRLISKAPMREPRTPESADAVGLIPTIQALRSMETGVVIGYRFRNPVEYANRVLDTYPWTFEAIIRMVRRIYGERYETPFRKAKIAAGNPTNLLRESRDFGPFYGLLDMLFDLNLTTRWWGSRSAL